ncbi:MAG: FMN-binding protein [Acidobacteria bacterium]|nr:FMN-binding protein [Acidobacteriota bacterium]
MKRREFITKTILGAGAITLASSPLAVWAQEKTYLTSEQALKLIFPKSEKISIEQKQLSDEQIKKVANILKTQVNKEQVFFHATTVGATDGYAMIVNEIGKDQYITFIVGLNPDFKVSRVALMVFRETRGWEVQDARFCNQFKNKSSKDRLLIGADIVGITGATLSARAFCRGTKKALVLCETVYAG